MQNKSYSASSKHKSVPILHRAFKHWTVSKVNIAHEQSLQNLSTLGKYERSNFTGCDMWTRTVLQFAM